ncbi:D-xylose dehydrogenase [Deinococcus saxicola]|uniref:Gfo/Idh/MocA family protein n=1 Tax=Deinococcus saxicola TaxID=249406 RepID=UPI0039F0081C
MLKTPLKVGLIGCGDISRIYLENAGSRTPFQIVAVADLLLERAQARAQEYSISRALTPDELLADPDIDAVLNLTIPAAHAEISRRALEAGKHVYSEKPLALNVADGQALVDLARERGLLIGCAPDTVLGAGLQTVRQLLDSGVIGRPLSATAFMLSSGVEAWHPSPDFFYQPGAGPLFDMGPYYLSTLVSLLGPVKSVIGQASKGHEERVITAERRKGERIPVNTPTHITALLDFESGAVATLITSFDVQGSNLPRIEIYGTEGTLSLPDPNTFGGPVVLRRAGAKEWEELPLTFPNVENSRGLGLRDLLQAAQSCGIPRASGALALHVLDIMQSSLQSAEEGRRLNLQTSTAQPEAMAQG